MTRSPPWSTEENVAVVALYFEMLDAEQYQQRYSKADMIRAVRGEPQTSCFAPDPAPLANRSRGSIEFKLMNASAAHADLNKANKLTGETMHDHGYRELPNYQADLKLAMRDELSNRDHGTAAEDHARAVL